MKPCKADMVRTNIVRINKVRIGAILLFLLATVPAYCQRGTLGVDVGQISDHFDGFAPVTSGLVDVNGELTVVQPSAKNGGPSIVAGGEIRFPTDTNNHAKEYALYGGLMFGTHNFTIGVDAQVRRIYLPPAVLGDQVFNRDRLELFQLPLVLRYKFGPARHAFFEARGEPEFKPHYLTNASTVNLSSPGFDHGYTLKGSVGYKFGQWYYVKGSYETRYFKFASTAGNPNDLYNWKSNVISGGVGLTF
jgi:hypothetical protein